MKIILFEFMLQVIKTYQPSKLKLVMKLCFVNRCVYCWWSVIIVQWSTWSYYFIRPSLFQYCWVQLLIFSPFCLQHCSHPTYKIYFMLQCRSVNSLFTVKWLLGRSVNIFVNISQFCIESVVHVSLVRPSLGLNVFVFGPF